MPLALPQHQAHVGGVVRRRHQQRPCTQRATVSHWQSFTSAVGSRSSAIASRQRRAAAPQADIGCKLCASKRRYAPANVALPSGCFDAAVAEAVDAGLAVVAFCLTCGCDGACFAGFLCGARFVGFLCFVGVRCGFSFFFWSVLPEGRCGFRLTFFFGDGGALRTILPLCGGRFRSLSGFCC